jgi:HD superfamily phosphodiesterase
LKSGQEVSLVVSLKTEPKYVKLYRQYANIYKDVLEFVKQYYERTAPEDRYAFHPWSLPEFKMEHVLRVLRYSMMLSIKRKVNLDVIALAAILHDFSLMYIQLNQAKSQPKQLHQG